jgi:polyferredoxin
MRSTGFLAHWYYHVPDLILTVLIGLLVARAIVGLIPWLERSNSLARLLAAVTDPVVRRIGFITPRVVPAGLVTVCAIAWLLAARIALFVAVSATGARLSMG